MDKADKIAFTVLGAGIVIFGAYILSQRSTNTVVSSASIPAIGEIPQFNYPLTKFGQPQFVDPNLLPSQIVANQNSGATPSSCGCGGSVTYYADNNALSAAIEQKYMSFANQYYQSIKEAFPAAVAQYFNYTQHTQGLGSF